MKFDVKKTIDKGLTNKNFVDFNNNFIRQSQPYTDWFLNHYQEQNILGLIANKNITLPIKNSFFDDNIFYLVTNYYPNLKTLFDQEINLNVLKQLYNLLKCLHQTDYSHQNIELFDPFSLVDKFKSKIKQPIINNLEKYESKINNHLKDIPTKNIVICHNDLTKGNIVFLNNEMYLIDFEYSALNDYLFDIASFASESLENKTDIDKWISLFNLNDNDKQRVNDWMYFQNILWIYWANYMYEQTQNKIFLEIIAEKYNKITSQVD